MGELTLERCWNAQTGQFDELQHQHDALGNRIQTRIQAPGSAALNINHLYYGSGHLHQINWEQEAPEGQTQPISAQQVICDIERDALHQEVGRSQGALQSRYQRDPLGRVLQIQTSPQSAPGHNALRKSYRYSATGEVIHSSHNLWGQTERQ